MWVKIDDKLHSHPKVVGLPHAALGLHLLALSYCGDQLTDGFVPEGIALRYTDTPERMTELVSAGLWEVVEGGWRIHDFLDFNPSRAQLEEKQSDLSRKRSEAGRKGARARWQNHGKPTFATDLPSSESPPAQPEMANDVAKNGPDPNPTRKGQTSTRDESVADDDVVGGAEVEVLSEIEDLSLQLCAQLADAIASNGVKRPDHTQKRWRTAARLLIERDGVEAEEVRLMIAWATSHEFWRANILSMPKLREKWSTLTLQAQRDRGRLAGGRAGAGERMRSLETLKEGW